MVNIAKICIRCLYYRVLSCTVHIWTYEEKLGGVFLGHLLWRWNDGLFVAGGVEYFSKIYEPRKRRQNKQLLDS